MFTGTRPFSGGTYLELSSAIDQGAPMVVSLHRADAPDILDRIVEKIVAELQAAEALGEDRNPCRIRRRISPWER